MTSFYELLSIIISLLIISLLYFGYGYSFFKKILTKSTKRIISLLPYENDTSFIDSNEFRDIYTGSSDKGTLHAYLKENNSNTWVIICHRYASSAYHMSAISEKYYKNNYNILIIDARAHGESSGKLIGMGWLERRDIISWCNYLIKNYGNTISIVLSGIGMGATTALMTSGEADLPKNVSCIIADSAYSNVYELFKYTLRSKHPILCYPILSSLRFMTNNIAYYDIKTEASTTNQLIKSNVPTLFIHGTKDINIPLSMFDELYATCHAPKEKLLIDNATHAECCISNSELYWNTVFDFITKYTA